MKWIPLYDKVIIELDNIQELTSNSGIKVIQDFSTNKYTILQGRVVACGKGRLLQDGSLKPLIIKPGDIVKFSKLQGETFLDEDKEYTIISESNILTYKEGE